MDNFSGKPLKVSMLCKIEIEGNGTNQTKGKRNDKVVGMKVRCQVIKNRMGTPLRTKADFEIYFDRGIDNYGSWLGVMKENKLVKQLELGTLTLILKQVKN